MANDERSFKAGYTTKSRPVAPKITRVTEGALIKTRPVKIKPEKKQ